MIGCKSALQDLRTRPRIDDLEQYSRRNCLIVHGIEEKQNENTDDIIVDLIQNKLKTDVKKEEIARTHRLGKRNQRGEGKPRPIITRFISYRQRKKVFDSKKQLKGLKLLVTENLTKKRYSLLQKCFDRYGKKCVWSLDGRIFCKEGDDVLVFTNEEDFAAT